MLDVTGHDVQTAARVAVDEALGRAGHDAGLPRLTWVADFGVAGVNAVIGQVSAGERDPERAAERWADELQLRLVGSAADLDDGVVTYTGELAGGLPVTVWAVVERDLWDAAQESLIERVQRS